MTSSIEPSRNTEYLEIRVQRDESAIDAMRLLEAMATIIDGPIADTRLHDWSGLPERTRLKVQRLYDKWQDAEDRQRVQGWQPIATAPKGKILLMFAVTDRREDGRVANWKMATGYLSYMTGDLTWDGARIDKPYDHRPTHWMPLPAPPDAEEPR
jgi:hypothetical protein